jgi:hypothetical protein
MEDTGEDGQFKSKNHSAFISSGTRWLVIGSGCFFGLVSFLNYAWFFVSVPAIILILGAVMQPRFNRLGRRLLAVGAFLVTLYGMFFACTLCRTHRRLAAASRPRGGSVPVDFSDIGVADRVV